MKRGQVTAFAIVGIAILALVITVFFVKDTLFMRDLFKQKEESITLPEHADKVKTFMRSCFEETLRRGIDLLSSRGGYIDIPEDVLPKGIINPMSNYLDVFNDGFVRVPYWVYQTQSGVLKTQAPTKTMMEITLSEYMDNNVASCFDGLEDFTLQGYEITNDQPVSKVKILDNEVLVNVYVNMRVIRGVEFKFEEISTSVNSRLGALYTEAVDVFNTGEEKNFLENYVYDMMVVYDEIPLSGVDFSCSPRIWTTRDVAQDLKKVVAMNVPLIKLENFKHETTSESAEYFVVAKEGGETSTTLNFMYTEEWPLLLDVLGEDGPVLRGKPFASESEAGKYINPLFCLNQYEFVYNIKLPVMVVLYDEGTGEIFQFAVQVIIDHNQPRMNKFDIPTIDVGSPICDYPSTELKMFALGSTPSGQLDPLANANIDVKCINALCHIGNTRLEGSEYALTAKVPACMNALVIASKEGYVKGEEMISTNEPATISMILDPLYNLNIETQIMTSGGTRPIQPTELAVFRFKNQGNGYETTVVVPGMTSITLAPGMYEVESSLVVIDESGIRIEGKTTEVCDDAPQGGVLGVIGLTEKKCREVEIEDITLKQVMAGGATFTWNANHDKLASAKKIILYTVRSGTPETFKDLGAIDKILAKNAKEVARPQLV